MLDLERDTSNYWKTGEILILLMTPIMVGNCFQKGSTGLTVITPVRAGVPVIL